MGYLNGKHSSLVTPLPGVLSVKSSVLEIGLGNTGLSNELAHIAQMNGLLIHYQTVCLEDSILKRKAVYSFRDVSSDQKFLKIFCAMVVLPHE